MITGEDIRRLEEEAEKVDKKLLVIETQQYFEIEVPVDVDPTDYVNSEQCRKICAARILDQTTDLVLQEILTTYDPESEYWT